MLVLYNGKQFCSKLNWLDCTVLPQTVFFPMPDFSFIKQQLPTVCSPYYLIFIFMRPSSHTEKIIIFLLNVLSQNFPFTNHLSMFPITLIKISFMQCQQEDHFSPSKNYCKHIISLFMLSLLYKASFMISLNLGSHCHVLDLYRCIRSFILLQYLLQKWMRFDIDLGSPYYRQQQLTYQDPNTLSAICGELAHPKQTANQITRSSLTTWTQNKIQAPFLAFITLEIFQNTLPSSSFSLFS